MSRSFVLFLFLLSTPALAQFNSYDVDTLKRQYRNFAEGNCTKIMDLRAAEGISGQMSFRVEDGLTPQKREWNTKLRQALKRVRAAAAQSHVGAKKDCKEGILKHLDDLDDIPTK